MESLSNSTSKHPTRKPQHGRAIVKLRIVHHLAAYPALLVLVALRFRLLGAAVILLLIFGLFFLRLKFRE